ncbi:MAG TPA: DUF881 domain-containing protein [Actinomycetales bacterium]|nr:DUF881 domain-containing protein [Actinomycetales bacterium]
MTTPRESSGRRLDASMTLLTEVMERPLDPGYEAAARRRRERGEPPAKGAVRSPLTLLTLVVVGLLLVAAGLQARGQSTVLQRERAQLVKEIQKQDAAAAKLQKSNAKLQEQIESDRALRLQQQAQGGLADQVRRLGVATGAVAVVGPGLVLEVDDAESVNDQSGVNDPRAGTEADDGRVLDQDLQVLVNGLWGAGAEAVAINGQRLTALSAIRSAGLAILVDYRPLSPPYRISAIGNPATLQARFSDGAGGRDLQYLKDNFGIRASITSSKNLTLPASSGLDVRHAVPEGGVPGAAVTPTTTGTTSGRSGSSSLPTTQTGHQEDQP